MQASFVATDVERLLGTLDFESGALTYKTVVRNASLS